jgi:hypothetical protein
VGLWPGKIPFRKVEAVDASFNHPRWIAGVNLIIHTARHKYGLAAILSADKIHTHCPTFSLNILYLDKGFP